MKTYLINNDSMKLVGVFAGMEAAEAGAKGKSWDYSLVQEVGDLKYTIGELATLYNGMADKPIKKFSNKDDGLRRTWTLLEQQVEKAPKAKKATGKRDNTFTAALLVLLQKGAINVADVAKKKDVDPRKVRGAIEALRKQGHTVVAKGGSNFELK